MDSNEYIFVKSSLETFSNFKFISLLSKKFWSKLNTELEKKWVFVPFLSSSLFILKSAIWDDFFVSFLNSDWSKYSEVEKNLGLKVKSEPSEITWK